MTNPTASLDWLLVSLVKGRNFGNQTVPWWPDLPVAVQAQFYCGKIEFLVRMNFRGPASIQRGGLEYKYLLVVRRISVG
jgi:hypothetical protein